MYLIWLKGSSSSFKEHYLLQIVSCFMDGCKFLFLTVFANPPSTFDSGVRKLNVCCKEAIVLFL